MEYNIEIRLISAEYKSFWNALDKHLPDGEFDKKVRDKQGYILLLNNTPVGLLRYNLFWDNTPFCTLLYIEEKYQRKGYGKKLMSCWEKDMQANGFDLVLVSTRADESAQYFYRALGYADCGSLNLPDQPEELFLCKNI